MPQKRKQYPLECWWRMVELARSGRSPEACRCSVRGYESPADFERKLAVASVHRPLDTTPSGVPCASASSKLCFALHHLDPRSLAVHQTRTTPR